MATSTKSSQAIIFGASGISGWAIARAAVLSKAPFDFSNVIALTSRPLPLRDSGLPDDPKLKLRSGLDLTKGVDAVTQFLSQIEGIENTTHVYFTGLSLSQRTSVRRWL
ncbi:hypothetical protein TARUN_9396 [Trichoderma arundinaceum]|uniref:PRISE-like Rossmann-fold domain-containing protein n=1 Tax=Trichoderma arundinaceum TaxID=490622 RepID=A0A395NA14_TRIAR|nr:hypothetical protein TARUN_9396 [Trichoderma arundinaceum]